MNVDQKHVKTTAQQILDKLRGAISVCAYFTSGCGEVCKTLQWEREPANSGYAARLSSLVRSLRSGRISQNTRG